MAEPISAAVATITSYVGSAFAASAAGTATLAQTLTVIGVNAAASLALSTAAQALQPQVRPPESSIEWVAGMNMPLPFAAGRCGVGGLIVNKRTYGADLRYYSLVSVVSAAGPIKSYVNFAADDQPVTFDANGMAVSSQYANELWVQRRLGAQPDAALTSPAGLYKGATLPGWTGSHKLSGLASFMMTMGENSKKSAFPNGEVKPRQTVEGLFVYSPALDSTYPGGVGTQRLATPSTWGWSDNPALWALKWCLGLWMDPTGKGAPGVGTCVGGLGVPISAIDVPAFVAAANVCDANGWKVAAWPTSDEDKFQVLTGFLQAAGCKYSPRAGLISIIQRAAPKTSLVTVTAADTAGPIELDTAASRINRINAIVPTFWSEANRWQMAPLAEVTSSTWQAEDGGKRSRGVAYPYVPVAKQAAELATLDIAHSREGIGGVIPFKPHMQRIRPGDCFTITEPGFVLDNQKCLALQVEYNPATAITRVTFCSETDGKYPFAFGQSPTPPPAPSLDPVDVTVTPAPSNVADGGGPIWTAEGTTIGVTDRQPAIIVRGVIAEAGATEVIIEYREAGATEWLPAFDQDANQTVFPITGLKAVTAYESAVSYRSQFGRISDRLILAPVTTGALVAGGVDDGDGDVVTGPDIRGGLDEVVLHGGRLTTAEGLIAANDAAIGSLEATYGSTASAAQSASDAATSATAAANAQSAAIQAEADAVIAKGDAQTAAGDALAQATNAAAAAAGAAGSQSQAAASAVAAASSHVATQAEYWKQFPPVPDTTGSQFSTVNAGAPADLPSIGAFVVTNPDGTRAIERETGAVTHRQTVRKVPGRIYRLKVVVTRREGATSGTFAPRLRNLNEDFSDTGTFADSTVLVDLTASPQTVVRLVSDPATAAGMEGVGEWGAAGVQMRPTSAGANWRLHSYEVTDVSESVAAGSAATASATSASLAETKATEAGSSATAAQASRVAAESARDAAGGSATAAATSASAAATSADASGVSASAAQTSATNASTSAGQASTFATNASNSATSAAGSASTATTQAGLSATSAGQSAGSATAAGISATSAASSSTAAGNSATAAQQSSVSAAASAATAGFAIAVIQPGTFATATPYTAASPAGGQIEALSTAPYTIVSDPDLGSAMEITGNGGSLGIRISAKGYLPKVAGRIYEVEWAYKAVTLPSNGAMASLGLVSYLDGSLAYQGVGGLTTASAPTAGAVVRAKALIVCDTLPSTCAQFRVGFSLHRSSTGAPVSRIGLMAVTDVTAREASIQSASAAATSASNASASATAAGQSATSSQQSATSASTSAGSASTSASQASTSATNAAGSANTATTQAGLASNSASAAGGSATAASNSAGAASTSATNAGNSASAAAGSALSASSSLASANNEVWKLFPPVPDATASQFGIANAGRPEAVSAATPYAVAQADGTYTVDRVGSGTVTHRQAIQRTPPGRIHELRAQIRESATSGTRNARLQIRNLNADYSDNVSWGYYGSLTTLSSGVTELVVRLGDVADAANGVVAWSAGGTQGRPGVSGSSFSIVSFSVRDVTEAVAASGSATAAATSASQASTSATAAGTSASASEASRVAASIAADSAKSAVYQLLPETFDASASAFTQALSGAPAAVAAVPAGKIVAVGGAYGFATSANDFVTTRGVVANTLGRIYEVEAEIEQTGAASTAQTVVGAMDEGFGGTGSTSFTTPAPTPVGVTTVKQLWGVGVTPTGGQQLSTSHTWLRFGVRPNVGSVGVSTVRRLRVSDVTARENAAAAASAAATSASSASASQTAAGLSASAASGSATTANTSASNASTFATQASNASDTATGAAASATASAGVAASLGSGASFVKDPAFSNWPVANAYPTNVTAQGSGVTPTRVTGASAQYGDKALRIAATATAANGLRITSAGMLPATPTTHVVVSYDITLNSGDLKRAGVFYRNRKTTGVDNVGLVSFWTRHGAGVAGTFYRGDAFVEMSNPADSDPNLSEVYGFNNHIDLTGGAYSAKDITWHRLSVRAATQAEIDAATVLPTLSAAVTVTQSAIVDIENQIQEAFFEIIAAAGGDPAQLAIKAGPTGSTIALAATALILRSLVNGTSIKVLEIINGLATFSSPVSIVVGTSRLTMGLHGATGVQIVFWFGPNATAISSATRTNGYWSFGSDGKVYYGSDELVGDAAEFAIKLSKVGVVTASVGTGQKTTPTITATPLNAGGAVSYNWVQVGGDPGWTITAPTGATTAFRNTLTAAGQQLTGSFMCIATDADGGEEASALAHGTVIASA